MFWSFVFVALINAQVERFAGHTVKVIDQNQGAADVFFDAFSVFNASGEADSQAPSPQNFGWLGACLSKQGDVCTRQIQAHQAIYEAFYKSVGQRNPDIQFNLNSVPDGRFQVETTWQESGDGLLVNVVKKIENRLYKGQYLVELAGKISKKKIELSFPRRIRSQRESFARQTLSQKELAKSVIQIVNGPNNPKNLLGRIVKSGTGFLVSADGLMLTNHHVIASYPDCLKYLRCQLTIRRKLDEENDRSFKVDAMIYAHDEGFDFALLKLLLPFNAPAIEIEEKKIGAEVITLGYPGDRLEPSGKVALTYSKGNIAGFKSRSFSTTAFVYPGASGSPLLNVHNYKLVGIISDVQSTPQKGTGNPAIARPIDVIDSDYGIRQYVSGEKQGRIDRLLRDLTETQMSSKSRKLLAAYVRENSLYRVGQLHALMVTHPVESIRKNIFQSLQKLNLIRGGFD